MLKIRLQRIGKKSQPSYLIVIIDSRKPSNGQFLKKIGYFQPIQKKISLNLKEAYKYLLNGAQPTIKTYYLIKKQLITKS
uniref:Small ribosomal subunit protein bS16c n=1 Tax=Pterocladiophila hemisphaerica TaxID=2712948 RepID=A0A6M3WWM0_9FLOR|nr:ribosomal protein S16 [Pterocladiophila hemisphaerica]